MGAQVVLLMTWVTFKNGTSIVTAWYILNISVSEIALIGPLLGKMFLRQLQVSSACPWQPVLGTQKLSGCFLNHIPDVNGICTLKGNTMHSYIHTE